VDMQRRFELTA